MINNMSVNFDNFISDWHTHTERIDYNVLVLVTQGKVQYNINGKEVTAEKGDILYIPFSTVRGGRNHDTGPHQKFTALFKIQENLMEANPFQLAKLFFK